MNTDENIKKVEFNSKLEKAVKEISDNPKVTRAIVIGLEDNPEHTPEGDTSLYFLIDCNDFDEIYESIKALRLAQVEAIKTILGEKLVNPRIREYKPMTNRLLEGAFSKAFGDPFITSFILFGIKDVTRGEALDGFVDAYLQPNLSVSHLEDIKKSIITMVDNRIKDTQQLEDVEKDIFNILDNKIKEIEGEEP